MLGVTATLLLGVMVLGAFGRALGAKGRHQRGADLAAVSATRAMRDADPRLFEPAYVRAGVPNSRDLDRAQSLQIARAAAVSAGRRNGIQVDPGDVRFDGDDGAPVRVTVVAHGDAEIEAGDGARSVPVEATATAELTPDAGSAVFPAEA